MSQWLQSTLNATSQLCLMILLVKQILGCLVI